MKEYYKIRAYMTFDETVYVPVNEVESPVEAKKIVADAVESYEIHLLDKDADYGGVLIGTRVLDDEVAKTCHIIHKEKNKQVPVIINRSGDISVLLFDSQREAIDFIKDTYQIERHKADTVHINDKGTHATLSYEKGFVDLYVGKLDC